MKNSPLMKGYLVGSKLLWWYIYLWEVVYGVIAGFYKPVKRPSSNPVKILLCNGAHYGDVLLSLQLIPLIRSQYPNSKVGFLTGSWNLNLVKKCKDLDYVHVVDHWSLNRKKINIYVKLWNYLWTRKKALEEIKDVRYNIAIDLYCHFPSSALLFFQAGIAVRSGYFCNGGKPLLTVPVLWQEKRQHVLAYQRDLLSAVTQNTENISGFPSPSFAFDSCDEIVLKRFDLEEKKYWVLHMGAGEQYKEWSLHKWITVCRYLLTKREKIVLTGAGEKEKKLVETVGKVLQGQIVDLCDKLAITEFMQIIKNSKAFIGVDSFAGHIAAMYEIKQIAIFHGVTNSSHWQPYNNKCQVVKNIIKCSPCYNVKRCKNELRCIQGIEVDRVIAVINEIT